MSIVSSSGVAVKIRANDWHGGVKPRATWKSVNFVMADLQQPGRQPRQSRAAAFGYPLDSARGHPSLKGTARKAAGRH
jgi:hypothetical protein